MARILLFSLVLLTLASTNHLVSRSEHVPAEEPDPDAPALHLDAAFRALPPPVAWLPEANGAWYRRTTASEQANNGWPAASFLVEDASVSAGTTGPSNIDLVLPFADGVVVRVPLEHVGSRSLTLGLVENGLSSAGLAAPSTQTATVYDYVAGPSKDEPFATPAGVQVTISDGGGMAGRAWTGAYMANLLGYGDSWQLTSLRRTDLGAVDPDHTYLVTLWPHATEVDSLLDLAIEAVEMLEGLAWGPFAMTAHRINRLAQQPLFDTNPPHFGESLHRTTETGDGAGSGSSSTSQPTFRFALFGEIKWCTLHKDDDQWILLMDRMARDIENSFNAHYTTKPPARLEWVWGLCSMAENVDDAYYCADHGGCKNKDDISYTYNANTNQARQYRDECWDDVTFARFYWDFPPLHLCHVLHHESMRVNGKEICGLSDYAHRDTAMDDPPGHGGSVSTAIDRPRTCTTEFIWSHEVGHSFDALHDEKSKAGDCASLMSTSRSKAPCRVNQFSAASTAEIKSCIDQGNCPRPGTE